MHSNDAGSKSVINIINLTGEYILVVADFFNQLAYYKCIIGKQNWENLLVKKLIKHHSNFTFINTSMK